MYHAKTAEAIEMLFGVVSGVGLMNRALDGGGVEIPRRRGNFGGDMCWPNYKV